MNKIRTSILGLCLILLMACGSKNDSSDTEGVQLVSPQSFSDKLGSLTEYNLLDVRSPKEFKSGHLKGAQNMNVNEENFSEKIALLDEEKPVLVYCRIGGRSATASAKIKDLGLEVYELDGGILSWEEKGFPLETNEKNITSGYTMETYNAAVTEGLVLVDFYATWCGPCKMMAPHVEALQVEYGDGLKVVKVDTDKSTSVAQHFKINAIPMVKVYKDGVETYSKVGYHSKEDLEAILNKNS